MENALFDKLAGLSERHWMVYAKKVFTAPFLGKSQDYRILDAGCGTGPMLAFFARWGEVVGLDSSEYALSLARRNPAYLCCSGSRRIMLVEAELSNMPFPNEYFDFVALYDVLYHRDVKDDEIVLSECARILKTGGRLVVIDSAFKFLKTSYDEEAHVARRYRLSEMKTKFAESGMRVQKASYIFFFIFPIVAGLRFLHNALNIRTKEPDYMFRSGPAMNALMCFIMRVESLLVRVVTLPFGTSLFLVGIKEKRS